MLSSAALEFGGCDQRREAFPNQDDGVNRIQIAVDAFELVNLGGQRVGVGAWWWFQAQTVQGVEVDQSVRFHFVSSFRRGRSHIRMTDMTATATLPL